MRADLLVLGQQWQVLSAADVHRPDECARGHARAGTSHRQATVSRLWLQTFCSSNKQVMAHLLAITFQKYRIAD